MRFSSLFRSVLAMLFVAALLVGFAATPAAEPAAAQEDGELVPVNVRLNWLWYGSHTGFFVAKSRGFYREEGLDVEILQGNGSGNTVQLIANKSNDFGYLSSPTMINLASQGAPVVSVATIDATDADAVMCRPDAEVSEPADLEGKTILTTAGAGVNVLFPVFLEEAGVDPETVSLTNVAENALVPSLLQGLGDCLLGGLDDKPAEIAGAEDGFEVDYIAYNEYIPVTVGYSLVAHQDTINESPEVVEAFVRATLRGFAAASEDPEAAVEDFMFYNLQADPDTVARSLGFTLSILTSPNNADGVLGLHVAEDWEATLNVLKEYRELETDMTADQFYTNDFIPEDMMEMDS